MGAMYYATGEPCKNGHVSMRRVSSRQCVECAAAIDKQWKGENHARLRATENARRSANRKKAREADRRRYWENPEKHRAKTLAAIQKNRAHYTAMVNKRRLSASKRIPSWSDLEMIECVYQEARLATEYFCERYEVDHIIPLHGKTVSGLHVPTNLRIATKSLNCSKGNRFGG